MPIVGGVQPYMQHRVMVIESRRRQDGGWRQDKLPLPVPLLLAGLLLNRRLPI